LLLLLSDWHSDWLSRWDSGWLSSWLCSWLSSWLCSWLSSWLNKDSVYHRNARASGSCDAPRVVFHWCGFALYYFEFSGNE
jgi:hypothetical protein